MSEIKNYLLAEIAKLAAESKRVLDQADAEGRELTPEEEEGQAARLKTMTEHKTKVSAMESREEQRRMLAQVGAVPEAIATDDDDAALSVDSKSPGTALVESKTYAAVVEQYKSTGSMPHFDNVKIEMKAPGDPVTIGSNQDALAPNWDDTLRTPSLVQFPLRVVSLLTVVQVEGGQNTISYPVVTTRTAPTGNPTDENESKPGAEFAFDMETNTFVKNAGFTGVSDEFFADASRLVAWINQQIGVMVLQAEEAQIVTAIYAAAAGNVATGAAIGGDSGNGFDSIREAMAEIMIAGGTPDGILAHPYDAAALDVLKASATDAYYSGGPLRSPLDRVWATLNIVETTAVSEGAPIVGAFRQGATLYRRGGLRVESSNSHANYFREDKVAIRAVLRSVLGVHYPEWFYIALTSIAS